MKKSFIALCAMASLSIGGFHAQAQGIEPAYTIVGNDSTCQIFVYSPAPDQGLRLAYLTEHGAWQEVGQLCSSDYGQWGAEKKMYAPFVTKAADGTWRAAWSVNDYSPCFAVAYSEDLVTWRPQDYPIVKEKGVLAPAIYQLDDGSFSIYLKTKQGKRYVSASEDFRTFKEDDLRHRPRMFSGRGIPPRWPVSCWRETPSRCPPLICDISRTGFTPWRNSTPKPRNSCPRPPRS